MELRSNRSRSKSRTSIEKEVFGGNHVGQTVIRTTRSTTVKTSTLSSDNDNITNINHNLESHSVRPVKLKDEKSTRKSRYKTSDYSSEDGDYHVTSTDTNGQNSKNQYLENMRRSVSRSSGSNVSALDIYRAAGDYWNKFPKTDYTYSPHSKDRTELAPGVLAMPNMSRRSLHSYESGTDYISSNKQTNTESYEHEEVDYSTNSAYNSKLTDYNSENFIRSRPRTLHSNNNSEDKYFYSSLSRSSSIKQKSIITRFLTTITSVFVYIFSYVSLPAHYAYKTQNSIVIWMGKKMHQLTTSIMLWDTWLLQSSTSKRKMSSLLALCLIPLVLLAGWWLLSGLGPLLSGTAYNFSSLMPSSPLFAATPDLGSNNIAYHYQDNERDSIIQTSPSDKNVAKVQTIIEEKIITIREKVTPPKADEIAAELTPGQLQEIANSIKHTLNIENQYNTDVIITKILENPSLQNVINNYNQLTARLEESKRQSDGEINSEDILLSQRLIIDDLRKQIDKVKLDLEHLEVRRNEEIANMIAQLRSENARSSAQLTYQLNRCCRHSLIHMESYVTRILKDLLGAPHYLSTQKDISDWLHATFVAKQDLEMHLANVTQNLKSDYDALIESSGKMIMDKVVLKISEELNNRIEKVQINMQNQRHSSGELKIDSLTDEYIKKIVQDALALYDADKTGLVDYALESAGGHILSTRCTESYQARTAVLSLFGIPLWYPTNTPRTVITPGMTPGECWAFQNFPGFLLVKLAAPIQIEAFSLEHISKMLTASGKIDSAPKEFSVYGLRNETDREPILLGQYVYDFNGPPLQYFAAEVHGLVFDIIELRVHSNHGNPNYTCLYRFRVHGKLSTEPT